MAHAALLRQNARCSLARCSWYARLSCTSAKALHNLAIPAKVWYQPQFLEAGMRCGLTVPMMSVPLSQPLLPAQQQSLASELQGN